MQGQSREGEGREGHQREKQAGPTQRARLGEGARSRGSDAVGRWLKFVCSGPPTRAGRPGKARRGTERNRLDECPLLEMRLSGTHTHVGPPGAKRWRKGETQRPPRDG